jgi:nitronate monooxygenase
MWPTTEITKKLGIEYPIIQAPMAGGATTPELVAAVSNSGGLGSLGAGYMAADDIRKAITKIRSLTNKPFAVNLFIPEKHHAI